MNRTTIVLSLASAVVLCGCASTYENYSTRDGNRVTATGQAAVAAGASHSSYNCINCGVGHGSYSGNPGYSYQKNLAEESAERIAQSASSAASAAISTAIYQSIYRGF